MSGIPLLMTAIQQSVYGNVPDFLTLLIKYVSLDNSRRHRS